MVISCVRIHLPLEEAMERYGRWIGSPEIEPAKLVAERDAIDLAVEGDDWRGLAVYIYAAGAGTVFEELSGGLELRSEQQWLELADGGDLVFAAYNDAIGYGELLCITSGELVRHFLQDDQDASASIDVGRLPEEDEEEDPLKDWTDVALWVETREDVLFPGAEQGWLWIHRADS